MENSSSSGSAHSRNVHPADQEVDQTQISTKAAKFFTSGFEHTVLVKKPNNYYLHPKSNGFPEYTDQLLQILRNHYIHYALSATKPAAETYLTQFLLSSYVCNHEEAGLSIIGYAHHPNRKPFATLYMNVVTLREALQLPTEEDLKLEQYSPSPSESELMELLEFLSYTEDDKHPLKKRGDFRRMGAWVFPLCGTLFFQ